MIHSLPRLALFLLCALSPVAWAAPRVVVSVAPLHSLVAGLMEGVGEPILWTAADPDLDAVASAPQVRELIAADLIVWSGPGLERGMARAIEQQVPAARTNLVTLSNHIPLLPRADAATPSLDRQASRDLRFWMDPRLAMHALHHLTPLLVRLDPEHTERYLENEGHQMHRLMQLEEEVMARLGETGAVTDRGIEPYFAHRFLRGLPASGSNDAHPAATAATTLPAPGPAYYPALVWREAGRAAGGAQALAAR